MKRRIAIWTGIGFFTAWAWVLYTFVASPEEIIAAHRTARGVDRTRPVCPYGKLARWKGAGSTDEAANFTCAADGN